MIESLVLPDCLRGRIEEAARLAFPRECCGLLEGLREEGVVRIVAVHPARNIAAEADRFEIDPVDQIRLLKALRGTGRDVVGCYHSHPNGRAEPSPRDCEGAFGEDFLWLIVALRKEKDGLSARLGAFEIGAGSFREVPMTPAKPAAA